MILINIPGTEQIKKSSGVFRNEWNPCAIDPEEHLEQKSAGFIPGRESVSRLVAIGRVCVTTSRLCPRSTRVSDSASPGHSCVSVALQARCGPWSIGVDITSCELAPQGAALNTCFPTDGAGRGQAYLVEMRDKGWAFEGYSRFCFLLHQSVSSCVRSSGFSCHAAALCSSV